MSRRRTTRKKSTRKTKKRTLSKAQRRARKRHKGRKGRLRAAKRHGGFYCQHCRKLILGGLRGLRTHVKNKHPGRELPVAGNRKTKKRRAKPKRHKGKDRKGRLRRSARRRQKSRTSKRHPGKRSRSAKKRYQGSALHRYNMKRKAKHQPREAVAQARIERKLAKKRQATQAILATMDPAERHRDEYRARLRERLAEAKKKQLTLF